MLTRMDDTPVKEFDESRNNWRADTDPQPEPEDAPAQLTFPAMPLYGTLLASLSAFLYALPRDRIVGLVTSLPLPLAVAAGIGALVALAVACIAVLVLTFGAFMYMYSRAWGKSKGEPETFLDFSSARLKRKWQGRAIPMETMFELYFARKIDFKYDVLDTLRDHRNDFVSFRFNLEHLKFFVTQWIPELLAHTKAQDESQVRDHYDRGNDFYNAFLGRAMVYTSGIRLKATDTLEEMQHQKIDLVCRKVQLKPRDRLLDIGCGWGTLALRAADKWGAEATGVTLSTEQVDWAKERARREGIACPRFLRMDYRDIPKNEKWDKITCLEMAEHVGVKNFNSFLLQVKDMLKDDGLFFLQIAGLRRAWQFEDLIWGLFMAKYVFPGADASAPLGWVIDHLEQCGWEVQTVDTIGCHYAVTLELWYKNWMENKETVEAKYGPRWFRKWEVFLAWSAIIANQGSATCFQITCHKNLNTFNRRTFWSRQLTSSSD